MQTSISRKEDMSPRGQLRVLIDSEGDIHLTVLEDDGSGYIHKSASVEFCSCGSGGGSSPHTIKALRELLKAIELDNTETPHRMGDW